MSHTHLRLCRLLLFVSVPCPCALRNPPRARCGASNRGRERDHGSDLAARGIVLLSRERSPQRARCGVNGVRTSVEMRKEKSYSYALTTAL